MRKSFLIVPTALTVVILTARLSLAGERSPRAAGHKTLNVLFIGNSYTARHNLSQLVKAMAEAGDPNLRFDVATVIYGGRRLVDHWRLGTQNYVKIAALTSGEVQVTIKSLEEMLAKDPEDKYAKAALGRHRELLKSLDSQRKKWEVVVLQSYRDDLQGDQSLYVEYAPKFAELIKAQGGRVVLYETTPTTQNAKPLTTPPDRKPVIEKARAMQALANKIDATVVPMSTVALRCQTVRPDLTLRFVNDAHLNQTLAYLTACTFYAALFDRSPEGLPIDRVTDIRYLDSDHKDQDRDGGPITRTYSARDRADLQRIAWEGLKQFEELAARLAIHREIENTAAGKPLAASGLPPIWKLLISSLVEKETGLLRERVVSIDALCGFDVFFLIGRFAIIRAVCERVQTPRSDAIAPTDGPTAVCRRSLTREQDNEEPFLQTQETLF